MDKDNFIKEVLSLHGNKLDLSNIIFNGKQITYKCSKHGEVTQNYNNLLKVNRKGCPKCDIENSKKKRKGSYSRKKGHNYELKIAKELNSLNKNFNIVTSRSESKRKDDNKIDLVDLNNKLPFYAQIKCTKPTPDYFKIEKECNYKDKPFVIFWNKQVVNENALKMSSKGELVILPKNYFYELIKK